MQAFVLLLEEFVPKESLAESSPCSKGSEALTEGPEMGGIEECRSDCRVNKHWQNGALRLWAQFLWYHGPGLKMTTVKTNPSVNRCGGHGVSVAVLCLHSTVRYSHLCKMCAVVAVLLWPWGICESDIGYWCWEVDVYTRLEYVECVYICCCLDCIMTVLAGTVACVSFIFCVSCCLFVCCCCKYLMFLFCPVLFSLPWWLIPHPGWLLLVCVVGWQKAVVCLST